MTATARRIRLDLAYDGTDFAGWQFQPRQRTAQGVLEQTLRELQGGRSVNVRGAGRTDSGVHANQQVADCEIHTRLDDAALARALCGMLPSDLRARKVTTAAPEFHARKHALSKTYHYYLDLTGHGNPFEARYALHYPYPLDASRLEEALRVLPGRRDWTGFTASTCDKLDRVRDLTVARLEKLTAQRWCLVFTADGFLKYMVRNLVGTLLEVGGGRMPLQTIEQVLDSCDRERAGPTAAARGLWLMRVAYPGEELPPS